MLPLPAQNSSSSPSTFFYFVLHNMRAWYLDDGECRCTLHILRELGVMYWFIPLDSAETSTEMLDQIKSERGYVNEDQIEVSEAKMGAQYKQKLEIFYSEHSHDDEEIRLVLEGEGYFDVRDSADMWIRIHVTRGDLIVLPKGIYHRFTVVPTTKRIVARRLFQSAPLWEAKNRFEERNHPQEVGGVAYGLETLHGEDDPRQVIPDICKQFYDLGWVSGTGGGMAVRHGNRLFMAPSGVMKERLTSKMIFVLDNQGTMLEQPVQHPRLRPYKLSECSPLFMHAFNLRKCGAVLHSHSVNTHK
jgi:1,2-dihydroxy-3-keto-5-methylthiopentene dioxygenase